MPKTTLTDVLQYMRLTCPNAPGRDLGDGALLDLYLAEGDETAFGILVHRHGPMVLSVCRRVLGDWHSAEDAFQATFLVLARRAHRIRKRASVGTWLYGVARRIAVRAKKQAAARRDLERRLDDMPRSEPQGDADWQELRPILDEEISQLPEKYQAPLILCYFEGRSYDRAAQELGWSKSTLAKRLDRARELLRGQLVRRGITLSAAALTTTLCGKASGAPLGAKLIINTVKAAISVATGKIVVAGCLSARAMALAEQAMTGMLGLKAKAILLVMALGLALGGAGLAGTSGAVPSKAARGSANRPSPIAHAAAPRAEQPLAQQKKPRMDLFGDPLPDGALARLGTMRFRHDRQTLGLVFAPGGKVLASGGGFASGIILWDAQTGHLVQRMPGLSSISSIAFAPDGKTFVGTNQGASQSLRLFDTATGLELRRLERPAGIDLQIVAFSADGRTVAVGEDGGAQPAIVLWDASTGKEIRRLEGHTNSVSSLAFSPDGKLLVSGSHDETVRLWDVATGKELKRIEAHKAEVNQVAISPTGKLMASVGFLKGIALWDLATGKQLRKLQVNEGRILHCAFSPDGKTLASGGHGKWLRLWDVETGREMRKWPASTLSISSLAFSPDGSVLATGGFLDHAIRLWDPRTGEEIKPAAGHTGTIQGISYGPNGRSLYSWAWDEKFFEWDLITGQERRRLLTEPLDAAGPDWTPTYFSALSPDGKALARSGIVSVDKNSVSVIRLWDTASEKQLPSLKGHVGEVSWLRFAPDGRLLASSSSLEGKYETCLWEVATGKNVYDLKGVTWPVFSPDGKLLAGFGKNDNTIRLWQVATGKELRRWESQSAYMTALVFSPDGKSLAGANNQKAGPVSVWATDTGKELYSFAGQGTFTDLAFSSSGRILAAAERVVNVINGDYVVTAKIHLWEAISGQGIREIDTTHTHLTSLAFAPDGRTLASGAVDSTILIWDLTGQANVESPPLSAKELDKLWSDLAADASKADRALWALALAPKQSVPLLKDRLRQIPPAPAETVAKLVADLESERFAMRQKASQALDDLGEAAEAHLRKALEANLTLEVRQRIEQILEKRNRDTLRKLRTIEALEQIGTADAQQILATLTKSAPNPRIVQSARSALERLDKRQW